MAARKPHRSESEGPPDGGAGSPPIFVCDASAEAERLMTTLRNRGHLTVDVPIGMLPSRVRYEMPSLVVCDADAHEALRRVLEMHEVASTKVKLLFVGHDDGALRHEPDFRRLATATLTRPLNLAATADLIESIVGRPIAKTSSNKSASRRKRAPVLVASARKPYRSDVDAPPGSGTPSSGGPTSGAPGSGPLSGAPSSLAPGSIGPSSGRPREAPDPQWAGPASSFFGDPQSSAGPLVADTNPGGPPSSIPPSSGDARLSPETRALLEEGRRRVASHPIQPARPTRLPASSEERGMPQAALLEALQRPLDDDDPGSIDPASLARPPSDPSEIRRPDSVSFDSLSPLPAQEQVTNVGARPADAPRSRSSTPERSSEPEPLSETPAPEGTSLEAPWPSLPTLDSQGPAGSTHATVAPPRLRSEQPPDDQTNPGGRPPTNRPAPTSDHLRELQESSLVLDEAPPLDDLSDLLPPDSPMPAMRGPLYRERESVGTRARPVDGPPIKGPPIAVLGQAIRERRTCSLAQEYGGGLRRVLLKDGDVLTATSSRDDETLPHFLQARGDLPADALPTLGPPAHFGRHAGAALIARGLLRQEDLWPVLRGHAEWLLGRVLSAPAAIVVEPEIPVRARDEPAVFGGAAGAEVFLEVLRRVVEPQLAFRALGSGHLKLGIGKNRALLPECGLTPALEQRVLAAAETDLALVRDRDPALLPILLGLHELEIISSGRDSARSSERNKELDARSAELDDEAFALRVAARRALVDEGDYFTILGIPRSATTHEVHRAREALFREFAPEQLPARAAHLQGDVAAILEVVAEAHDILKDEVKRERYRRALDDAPRDVAGSSRR